MTRELAHPLSHQVLRASAGSGKTYRLATRYLALLRAGQSPPTILATTFTRKAAGEILGRVLVRLSQTALEPADARQLAKELDDPTLTVDTCRRLLEQLCGSLHRVSISTLDSFFSRLAQSFRYELAIPPVSSMSSVDDPRVVELRAAAIEAMLGDDEPALLLDLLRRLHHDSTQCTITGAIDRIVSSLYDVYRGAPNAAAWTRVPVPAGRLEEAPLRAAIAALGKLADDAELTASFRGKVCDSCNAALSQDWDAFLSKGPAKNLLAGNTRFGKAEMPDRVIDAYRPLIAHARADLIGRYADLNEATHQLMTRFDRHFTRLREAAGVLLFSDLPYRLGRHLGARAADDTDGESLGEIYYRLDGRVSHLLLDEFQDTSPEQWRVLLPLAQEICSYADASRTFFCVGDVKQAIYGWRGGAAELFDGLNAELHLPKKATSSLSVSYRSSQVVLNAVNEVFGSDAMGHILTNLADGVAAWQRGFERHEAFRKLPGYVELWASARADEAAEETEEAERPAAEGEEDEEAPPGPRDGPHLDAAARRVARVMSESPGRSIGVLTSRNAVARSLLDRLRALGVPASGESGVTIDDDPAVGLVLSAMTLADHPGDSACAYHVLHSPLAPALQMTDAEPATVERVALAIRADLLQRGYARVVADWAGALAPSCDAQGGRRLAQLVELADTYDPALTLRPRQFAEFVRATPIEEASTALVRVMTVHKAKGLEFDIVFLPELERRVAQLNQQIVYQERPAPTAGVTGVYRATNASMRAMLPDVERAHQQERDRRLRDDLSGLYVALTRARHALHLVVKPLAPNAKGEPRAEGLRNASYASILRRALAPVDEGVTVESDPDLFRADQLLYHAGDAHWHGKVPAAAHAPAAAAHPPPPPSAWSAGRATRRWPQVSPSSLEGAAMVKVDDLLELAPSPARARGSLIHAWFEQIEFLSDDPKADPHDAALLEAAREMEVEPTTAAGYLNDFRRMLARPVVRAALRLPAAKAGTTFDLWREREFVVQDQGRLLRGVFDRVVVSRRAGKAFAAELLDFKTDRIEPGQLAAVTDHYRPQIAAYRSALARMLGLRESAIAARLLFVGVGESVDL